MFISLFTADKWAPTDPYEYMHFQPEMAENIAQAATHKQQASHTPHPLGRFVFTLVVCAHGGNHTVGIVVGQQRSVHMHNASFTSGSAH